MLGNNSINIIEDFNTSIAQNSGNDYLYSIILFFSLILFFKLFKLFVSYRISKKEKNKDYIYKRIIVEIFKSLNWPLFFVFSLYISSIFFIKLPNFLIQSYFYILLIVGIYYAVKVAFRVLDLVINLKIEKKTKENLSEGVSFLDVLRILIKAFILILALLMLLSNLNFNISSLIAGLGIGGIAIAFALQSILSDLFSSFSIYFDKPFTEGDFIIIGEDMGVVKKIGIKSTRIQTLQGQELIVSNKELTSIRINNYNKMSKRRIAFFIGVEYSTPKKKLEKIPKIIEKIIQKIELSEFDRAHFKSFGDFSLNYEIVYYVDTSDYTKYMDIQQQINLALVSAFEKEKIEFAFPSRTIYLKK
ncbi:MAG: mechanosensitive ion channel family protein [Nanoarchaeota archaeon]